MGGASSWSPNLGESSCLPLEGTASITDTELTSPLNLAGLPALSLPLPTSGGGPGDRSLSSPPACGEALLLAVARVR